MDDYTEHKKAKGAKMCFIKRRLMFEIYTYCLFNDEIISKSQQRFKSHNRIVYQRQKIEHFYSYSKVPKDVRLNSTHFFIIKISNKRELQQIALNHSSGIRQL